MRGADQYGHGNRDLDADRDADGHRNGDPDANRDPDADRDAHGNRDPDANRDTDADTDPDCDEHPLMAQLRVRYNYTLVSGSVGHEYANPFYPPNLTLNSTPAEYTVKVPFGGAAVILWNATGGGANPASFALLVLDTDKTLELEIRAHDPTEAQADSLASLPLVAGHIPFALGGDAIHVSSDNVSADGAGNITTGNVGVISRVRAFNHSTDTDAYVRVVVGGV